MTIDGITLIQGTSPRRPPPNTIYCDDPADGVDCSSIVCCICPIHSRATIEDSCSEMFFRFISRPIIRRSHASALPIPST